MGEGLTPFEVEATGRLGQAAMTLIKAVVTRDETFSITVLWVSSLSCQARSVCIESQNF
jgi:hypothetical protein